MIEPPSWDEVELERDRQIAIEAFRHERLTEPLEVYLDTLDKSLGEIETLLEATVDLTRLREQASTILSDGSLKTAFRYLAGPPISDADLETVVGEKLSRAQVRKNPHRAEAAAQAILDAIDRRRFPWVTENREPSEHERSAAALATAALIANQQTSTLRRHSGKKAQEAAVATELNSMGMDRVATRRIGTIAQAPQPGEFCSETMLGTRKADYVVGLYDRRILPIECKVSNSAVNSIKRLSNDAAIKAEVWRKDFGARQVTPMAVLSGVYELHSLVDAQARGLALIWAHNLGPLVNWIRSTRV